MIVSIFQKWAMECTVQVCSVLDSDNVKRGVNWFLFICFVLFFPEVMFIDGLCHLCTGLNRQLLKKLKKSPLTFGCLGQVLNTHPLYRKTVCSLFRYLLGIS